MEKLNGWRHAHKPPKHSDECLVYGIPIDSEGKPACRGKDKHGGLVGLGWYERYPSGEWEGWMTDWLKDNHVLFWKPLPKLPEFD
jgi:hypothetical protein